MQETHCPECFEPLEVRDVTPCQDCGWEPHEREHMAIGMHYYCEYEVFPGHQLILCNFCAVDFGSYDETYFGLPRGTRIGYQYMRFIRSIEPRMGKDKFCNTCKRSLSFLRFLNAVRQATAGMSPKQANAFRP
ncbi:hypothetical protein LBMAG53_33230 [Planctomycetota bacterium]|nr:hypothetical protein LBMAG53_33230 [Planctomycetota bacterium]